jgi:hypothetical protein
VHASASTTYTATVKSARGVTRPLLGHFSSEAAIGVGMICLQTVIT